MSIIPISRIRAHNFGMISDLDFKINPGESALVLGQNEDQIGCESNGSAKSMLFETIPWVFSDKTLRGVSGSHVARASCTGSSWAELSLSVNGVEYVVRRVARDSKLGRAVLISRDSVPLDPKKVDTKRVLRSIIPFELPVLSACYLFGGEENNSCFSRMSDSEYKSNLDYILGTAELPSVLSVVKDKIDKLGKDSEECSRKVDHETSCLESLQQRVKDMRESMKTVTSLTDSEVSDREARLRYCRGEKKKSKKKLSHVRRVLNELCRDRGKLREEKASAVAEAKLLRDEIDKLKRQVKRVRRRKGEPCPFCHRKIVDSAPVVDTIESEICLKAERLVVVDNTVSVQKRRLLKLDDSIQELEERAGEYQELIDERRREISRLDKELSLVQEQRKSGRQRASELAGKLQDLNREIESREYSVRSLNKRLRKNTVTIKHLSFLKMAFGNQGVRSFMLDHYAPKLTELCTEAISDILPGFAIRFTTRDEGSEKVCDRFTMSVFDRRSWRSYKSFSSGEKCRIDVPVMRGFRSLWEGCGGTRLSVIVYDEVLSSLDSSGTDAILDSIRKEADEGFSVFVIVNSPAERAIETYGKRFDRVLVMHRKGDVSHLEEM